MHIERTDQAAVFIGGQQAAHPGLLHLLQRFGGQLIGRNGLRARMHHLFYQQAGKIIAALKQAAQIAIGENAFDAALFVYNRQHAQAGFAHAYDAVFQ